mgnify:FL=1
MSGVSYMDKLLNDVAVEWKPLGTLAEIYGGLTGKSKSDFDGGNAKYVSYKNIFANINVDFSSLESVKVSDSETQHKVKYGDILFTGSSETADEAGMSSAVTTHFEEAVFLNSFSFGVRFNKDIPISSEFSKYLFRTSFMRSEIAKTASGVTRFNVSKERFKKILVPILSPDDPKKSLEIQAEIVRILDNFTELTAELTAELTTRKKQYTYYRDKLLSFEDGVPFKRLGEIVRIKNGKDHKTLGDGEFPVYGSGGIMRYADTYAYNKPSVLIPRKGSLGNLFFLDVPFWNVDTIFYTEIDETQILPKFLYYFLTTVGLGEMNQAGGVPSQTQSVLNALKIPVPSIKVQREIVAILDKFDALTNSITEGLPREIELRQKQYAHYRDLLLSFPKSEKVEA